MNAKSVVTYLKAELGRINKAIFALEALDSTGNTTARRGRPLLSKATPKARRKRRLTTAGRKRLSEMMKKRWAERRQKANKPAPRARARRRLSTAARKRMSQMMKARWAAKKKAAAKAE